VPYLLWHYDYFSALIQDASQYSPSNHYCTDTVQWCKVICNYFPIITTQVLLVRGVDEFFGHWLTGQFINGYCADSDMLCGSKVAV